MKPWHHGLPETKQIVVFPPLGRETAFVEFKDRIRERLAKAFPDLSFEFASTGLYPEASVMPMCGTAGGPNSRILAPPAETKISAIEAELGYCCESFITPELSEPQGSAH
ncbi:hypothetical protein [Bosea sp. (in: a-proteobacteria)]|uniref:hypothetical protein n=1 Tax=Bosea sp. (in: a-proteobacteria) TaxID=1871050 RepID=UPI002637DF2E|nr:hypothetical protein [Bosea sp. (in: a-proteobacteria)]MCO5092029.1 hypothetical protein [Bosea sp. (in: a-proteobacteria)]